MIDLFLVILAIVWLIFASLSDLKKREIPNWLSFSLITFALVYRAVYSILYSDLWFFVYGLVGLLIFVVLGYVFYYGRVFAGGDAKLLFGLGAILPMANSISLNLMIFAAFLFIMLVSASVYGLIWSFSLAIINRKAFSREFVRQFKNYRLMNYVSVGLAFILLLLPMIMQDNILFFIPLLVFIFPFLFIFAKTIEQCCMIRTVFPSDLTEGDWLYQKVKVKGKIIKPDWEGLSLREIKLLKHYRGKVKIKVGIPFIPVFLISFLVLIGYLRYLD